MPVLPFPVCCRMLNTQHLYIAFERFKRLHICDRSLTYDNSVNVIVPLLLGEAESERLAKGDLVSSWQMTDSNWQGSTNMLS